MTGILQQQIIKMGKEKGFVSINDLRDIYSKNIKLEMNKLVIRGYFKEPEDHGTTITWRLNEAHSIK